MKNLRLRVKSDGNVYVSAPYGIPVKAIDEFVESRAEWIAEQRKHFAEIEPPKPVTLSDGSLITLFGRQYTICTVLGSGEAYYENDKLIVPLDGRKNIEAVVLEFMGKKCRHYCTEAVKIYLARAGYKGVTPRLEFKYLKSRWGSYNMIKNTITFNLALCKLSGKFIKYVAAHEVTHIFVHNHSKDFYNFGETIFENFLKTDRELNKIRNKGLFS